jgi:hypothetical protein
MTVAVQASMPHTEIHGRDRWNHQLTPYLPAMKKQTRTKMSLNRETLRTLDKAELGNVAGAAPVTTRDLPCIPPPP